MSSYYTQHRSDLNSQNITFEASEKALTIFAFLPGWSVLVLRPWRSGSNFEDDMHLYNFGGFAGKKSHAIRKKTGYRWVEKMNMSLE